MVTKHKETKAERKIKRDGNHQLERRRNLTSKAASTLSATGIETAVEIIYQDAATIGDLGHMNAAIGRRLQLESLKLRLGVYRRMPPEKQLFLK